MVHELEQALAGRRLRILGRKDQVEVGQHKSPVAGDKAVHVVENQRRAVLGPVSQGFDPAALRDMGDLNLVGRPRLAANRADASRSCWSSTALLDGGGIAMSPSQMFQILPFDENGELGGMETALRIQ